MRTISCLLIASLVFACRELPPEQQLHSRPITETSNGIEGIGSPENPVEKVIQGIRFQQKGLEIEHAEVFVEEGRMLTADDSVNATDTVLMPLHIRGWRAPDGFARVKFSTVTRRPDGRIAHRMNTFKEVIQLDISEGILRTMEVFSDLDTTQPFYDCEFTITDVGNGRSLTGTYRYKLK
jgi:hypothetical protein